MGISSTGEVNYSIGEDVMTSPSAASTIRPGIPAAMQVPATMDSQTFVCNGGGQSGYVRSGFSLREKLMLALCICRSRLNKETHTKTSTNLPVLILDLFLKCFPSSQYFF